MTTKYFDKKAALKAVKQDGPELKFVSMELRNDREVVLEAAKEDVESLEFASKELRNDKTFWKDFEDEELRYIEGWALYLGEELLDDKEYVLGFVKDIGSFLKLASARLRNDKEVVLQSVKNDGRSLKYVSERLKNDKEVVLESLKHDGKNMKYASEALKNDKLFVLEAVREVEDLKKNREFVLEVLNSDIVLDGLLEFVDEELLFDDEEIVLIAVKHDPDYLKYVSEELKEDSEVLSTLELSKMKQNISRKIRDEYWSSLMYFLTLDIEKTSVMKASHVEKLEEVLLLLNKRSQIESNLKSWNLCLVDCVVSLQIITEVCSKVTSMSFDKFSKILSIRLKKTLQEVIKKEFLTFFVNADYDVKEQMRAFVGDFSWLDSGGNKDLFSHEWEEDGWMKNELVDRVRTKLSEVQYAQLSKFFTPEVLGLSIEQIRTSIYEKYILRSRKKIELMKYISEDSKRAFKEITKDLITPLFLTTLLFENDIKFEILPKKSRSIDHEKAEYLSIFGFFDEGEDFPYGFGLEIGLFRTGFLGYKTKNRRLFYGKYDKNGLRYGKNCKEYSPKDGKLIFEGGYKNGKRDGKGIEYVHEKKTGRMVQVFEGKYQNGKRHGRGESIEKGVVVRGTWRKGKLDETTVFKFGCPIFKYADVKKHLNDSQKVGKGAFGVIYKVRSSAFKGIKSARLGNYVAVKILEKASCSMEQQVMTRMIRRGIGFCYSVECENILESYGIILGRGHRAEIGYVMKLCEKSIDKLIEQGEIPLEEKIRILKETAVGIHSLHEKYLIHRDLKWGNVLLDFDGVVKITDFDTVKEEELHWRLNTLFSQSARVGTPGFRPPEVITGKKYTFKCDVYAFGLMIYSLLFEKNFPYITRSHCSCGEKMTDIVRGEHLEKHISECNLRPLMNPDEVNKYPSFLIDLMVQCWNRNPFNRPSFEDILFMFRFQDKKNVYKISFRFPKHPGVQDQTMFIIKPFRVGKIINWIEKKFEKPFEGGAEKKEEEEESEGEEEEGKKKKKKTKVLRLEHSVVGTIHSNEDLEKVLELEEFPCLRVTLNFIDESFVIGSVNRKITFEEYQKVEKSNKVLDGEIKRIRREKAKLMRDLKLEREKVKELLETVKLREKQIRELEGNRKIYEEKKEMSAERKRRGISRRGKRGIRFTRVSRGTPRHGRGRSRRGIRRGRSGVRSRGVRGGRGREEKMGSISSRMLKVPPPIPKTEKKRND